MLCRFCKTLLLAVCAFASTRVQGRPGTGQKLRILFAPSVAGRALTLYEGMATDSLRITSLRFYLSGFNLVQRGKTVWRETASYHLLDAASPESLTVILDPPAGLSYDAVRFNLGIDSATNAGGAQGGALDATKGMYWAWQSGYINFRIEGVSPQSKARRHGFQFHLGGFGPGKDCLQTVTLPVDKEDETVMVIVDLDAFLAGLDLAAQSTIMIPGAEAVGLSKKAAQMFRISRP